MYELGRDVLVGLRRADILFAWLRLDNVVGVLPPLRRALGARPTLTATTWAAVVHAVRAAGEPPEPSKPAPVLPFDPHGERLLASIKSYYVASLDDLGPWVSAVRGNVESEHRMKNRPISCKKERTQLIRLH